MAAEKTRLTEEAAKQHAMCDRLTTAVQDAQAQAAQKQEALRIEQSKVRRPGRLAGDWTYA